MRGRYSRFQSTVAEQLFLGDIAATHGKVANAWIWIIILSLLKIKGQPRSGETLMMFMPPRRARPGRLTIGELQGFPEARRVIFESPEATLLSLQGSSGDGWGAEGLTVQRNAALKRWEHFRLSIS